MLFRSICYDVRDEETIIASSYAFRRRFLPEEILIDEDNKHLIENIYPKGNKDLLKGGKFLQTLKAVAYSYQNKK